MFDAFIIDLFFFKLLFRSREDKENYLSGLIRDNVQLLLNEIWELPTERVEECVVAKLPPPVFVLPRSRKCPVAKPLTKWEKFAKEKGIKKVKKDKKVFDTELEVSTRYFCILLFSIDYLHLSLV